MFSPAKIASKRILIVGDVMLDVYHVGTAHRISPEAPVPVLLNPTTEYRLGGAGAVAAMCVAMGAQSMLLSVTGNDANAERIEDLAREQRIGTYILADEARPTTTKERICGVASGRHRQQLGRIDYESTTPLPDDLSEALAVLIRGAGQIDAIVIADYNKGVCTPTVVRACRETGFPVFIDPPHDRDWSKYFGFGCLVPNRDESLGQTASAIRRQMQSNACIVKLDEDGCVLDCEMGHGVIQDHHIPARARAVHDVTGAGDQFIATLACARANRLNWVIATELANTAAGLQVERHGCVPVTIGELDEELFHNAEHLYAREDDSARETLASAVP